MAPLISETDSGRGELANDSCPVKQIDREYFRSWTFVLPTLARDLWVG